MRLTPLLLVFSISAALRVADVSLAADDGDLLKTLHAGHPRIILTDTALARVKRNIETDPYAKKWLEKIVGDAGKMLRQSPVKYELIGPRLLDKSRTALTRISTLAAVYRFTGDARYADRAKLEMATVCAFVDWHPPHFLDTAEMTNAVGLGYDWLYSYLTPEERATFKKAIVEKGLIPGKTCYEKKTSWTTCHHNWGQVCAGGMAIGALAIADEEPDIARYIMDHTRKSIVNPMLAFRPDGGCPEGPGYWGYAMMYNTFYLAATESALGTDFGLKATPGFSEAGMFRIHANGPINETFNYADAHSHAGGSTAMFWLGSAFNRPLYQQREMPFATDRPSIFHLIWYDPKLAAGDTPLPLDAFFHGVNVTFFRSAWNDSSATYIGFKGGDNRANHSHLDLGSFVLDSGKKRFAVDLGPDDYNLPAYFGNKRFTYYRLSTAGHNTLTIDDANQDSSAKVPIIGYLSTPARAFSVADLTDAYEKKLKSWRRGIALLDRRNVLLQDEVEAKQPVKVTWNFHTDADITLGSSGAEAKLVKGSANMRLKILSPTGATFKIVSANPPPPEGQQPHTQNLTIPLPAGVSEKIVVWMTPGNDPGAPPITPLETWVAAGKVRE